MEIYSSVQLTVNPRVAGSSPVIVANRKTNSNFFYKIRLEIRTKRKKRFPTIIMKSLHGWTHSIPLLKRLEQWESPKKR